MILLETLTLVAAAAMILLETLTLVSAAADAGTLAPLPKFPTVLNAAVILPTLRPSDGGGGAGSTITPLTGWDIPSSEYSIADLFSQFSKSLTRKLATAKSLTRNEFLVLLNSFLIHTAESFNLTVGAAPTDANYTHVTLEKLGFLVGPDLAGPITSCCVLHDVWDILETLIKGTLKLQRRQHMGAACWPPATEAPQRQQPPEGLHRRNRPHHLHRHSFLHHRLHRRTHRGSIALSQRLIEPIETLTLTMPIETLTLTPPHGTLIPDLPDDLAALILAALPFSHHPRLRATSRSWHAFLSPRRLLSLRRRLRLPPRHLLCLFLLEPSTSPPPLLFDPAARAWAPLPRLPCSPNFYGLSNFALLSIPPYIYVLGGSQFDARDFPLGRPGASAAVHRLDLSAPRLAWSRLPDMITPRGSFACASLPGHNSIIVAGGGSRHPVFPSEGSRLSSVERYDVRAGEWRADEGLPKHRAGCVGFVVKQTDEREEDEFWVMGGYGDYFAIADVVPASVYYRDAVVLGLRSGKWREVGDMWEAGERYKLGSVVAVDGGDGQAPGVYMLDRSLIFRYDFASNRWWKESGLRKKISEDEPCSFVAMNRELYVMTSPKYDPQGTPKKRPSLEIQVYNPKKRKWRFLRTCPPFEYPIDLKSAVSCTIRV